MADTVRNSRSGYLWCGSYTKTMGGIGEGIGVLRTNAAGAGEFLGLAAQMSSPSFVARKGDLLYAVDEAGGSIRSFRIMHDSLQQLDERSTSGAAPCHITIGNEWLYVSNYGSGSIDVFPIAKTGTLGPLTQSLDGTGTGPHEAQDAPHAHSTLLVGDSVLSADLGADRVHVHHWESGRFVRTGSIVLPAGTGPRDLALLGGRVLVLGELSGRVLELAAGEVVADGPIVAEEVAGDHAAALVPDARGRFLYTALRGSDRIAVIDARTLTPVDAVPTGGRWPRHLTILGSRLFVANQLSSTVTSFAADPATGILSTDGHAVAVPSPTFLLPEVQSDLVQPESLIK